MNMRPPFILRAILEYCVHPADRDEVMGDLDELYAAYVGSDGLQRARAWYVRQVLVSAPAFILQSLGWSSVMLKNYATLALRTLNKQKIQGFINLSGLTLGIALAVLILLFVRYEWTFDQVHEGHEDIVQIQEWRATPVGAYRPGKTNLSLPLSDFLAADVPGVAASTRVWEDEVFVRRDDDIFEAHVLFIDPSYHTVFPFRVLSGDPQRDGIVLTASAAERFLGTEEAVGASLEVRVGTTYRTYDVVAVLENPPANASTQFELLAPITDWIPSRFPQAVDAYGWSLVKTYARLHPDADRATVDHALLQHFAQVNGDFLERLQAREPVPDGVQASTWRAVPLSQMYLTNTSDPAYSFTLIGLGMAILLIACINFMTLAIGRSLRRSREVGIRKAVGAVRGQLLAQFWGEAFFMTVLATLLGLGLAWYLLPTFNDLTDRALTFTLLEDWSIPLGVLGIVVLTGLIAGSYPALVLSSFRPIDVLKSRVRVSGSNLFTKGLVTLQFTVSIVLIIATLVMHRQATFVRDQDRGYETDQVVLIDLNGLDGQQARDRYRDALAGDAGVVDMTLASNALGYRGSWGFNMDYEGSSVTVDELYTDHRFLEVLDISMQDGRAFNPDLASDSAAVILNQAFVERFGLEDPVGKPLPDWYPVQPSPLVIGVTSSFRFQSLYQDVGPLIMSVGGPDAFRYLYVHLAPGRVDEVMGRLASVWTSVSTDVPFSWEFMDERMERVYAMDLRWGRIINVASACAIFLALLGLLGLTSLSIQNRTKELSVRRVLGASRAGLVMLIFRSFSGLILLGSVVAVPLGLVFARKWLENYAFQATIGPGIFVAAVGLVFVAAFVTIAAQSFRTVATDPATALRAE
ncbi:MAG: FtsX-like permease family protein [Rhodothermales bacterium]